jgi:sulfoxide reductase heme-binding subunit YedZ
MLGLFSYVYACTHFSIYIVLEQWFDLELILEDIQERPFITIGVINLILLTPLAVTSTDAMRARLQTSWLRLHKLIYLISILAIIHFWWSAKADLLMPFISASVLAFLLAYRFYSHLQMKNYGR